MILGEVQYRNALPWGLVLVHVTLAAMIWALDGRGRVRALAPARALARSRAPPSSCATARRAGRELRLRRWTAELRIDERPRCAAPC